MYWKPSVEYCRRGLLSVTRCGKKQSGEDSNCCRRGLGDDHGDGDDDDDGDHGDGDRGDGDDDGDDDAISILDHIKYMLLMLMSMLTCVIVKSWWLY